MKTLSPQGALRLLCAALLVLLAACSSDKGGDNGTNNGANNGANNSANNGSNNGANNGDEVPNVSGSGNNKDGCSVQGSLHGKNHKGGALALLALFLGLTLLRRR